VLVTGRGIVANRILGTLASVVLLLFGVVWIWIGVDSNL
jgi:hypothetical protein